MSEDKLADAIAIKAKQIDEVMPDWSYPTLDAIDRARKPGQGDAAAMRACLAVAGIDEAAIRADERTKTRAEIKAKIKRMQKSHFERDIPTFLLEELDDQP